MTDIEQLLKFLGAGADLSVLPMTMPDASRVKGAIKSVPGDFIVEEIPAYPFSGEGDHILLFVQKTDIAGGEMLRILADTTGARPDEIGTAGTKDRRAVTRQWISIPRRSVDPERFSESRQWPELPGIRILDTTFHTNKLKPGHLSGNRFRIMVRGADAGLIPEIEKTAQTISSRGFPNLFGSQRFGRNKESLLMGLGVLGIDPTLPGGRRGRRVNGFERRMTVSSIQSALFNLWIKARYDDDLTGTVLSGDIMSKTETGGMFKCDDPVTDQTRLEAGEIGISGPMFGTKMKAADQEAGIRENAILEAAGLDIRNFGSVGKLAQGTRRDIIVVPEGMTVEAADDGIVFSFALPKGSYASVLMREFVTDTRGI